MSLEQFLALVVIALAAYRATRVVVADSISDPFRAWLWRHAFADGGYDAHADEEVAVRRSRVWAWIFEGLSCAFCTGWWLSLAGWWAWFHGAAWCRTGLAAVAVAGLQALLSSRSHA